MESMGSFADSLAERPHVVILGGGFAGVGAAKKLKHADADVVLVDQNSYHTFQPLLYQVATAMLDRSDVEDPLRDLFHDQPNVAVYEATVTGIDLASQEVQFAGAAPLPYTYLVLALGAQVNFFGVEGAAQYAFPLYTLEDALRLKQHIAGRWMAAEQDPALVDDGALNVVVVGGGPTGVESAGALAELYRTDLPKDYPTLPQEQARITLVEAGPELFAMFKPDLRSYVRQELEKRGVEVLVGEVATSITPRRVTLKSGNVLSAHTLVWGAGLQAHPLTTSLGLELQRGNRIAVEPDLSIPGHPEVFAVGDIAWITDTGSNQVLPQLGSVAMQAGEKAGENIGRLVAGQETEPFAYTDKGTMATIGHGAAVIQMHGGRTIKGRAAWLAWGAVHLALLSTREDRARTMTDWTWDRFTNRRADRMTMREAA
jgi:NADH dehydrogenase